MSLAIRCGWRGAILSGDIIQVVSDRSYVSFMYSYPNLIPLSAARVRHILAAIEALPYDRIYGSWWESPVPCPLLIPIRPGNPGRAHRWLSASRPPG